MSTELKIKAKSLAEEAHIIRREEQKLKAAGRGDTFAFQKLYLHRVCDVRKEARATHLARAYLKGMPYAAVEDPKTTRSFPPLAAVHRMVTRYGEPKADAKMLVQWYEAAHVASVAAE